MALGFHEGALPSPKDPNVTCISTPPGSILVVFGGLVGGVAIMFLPSYLWVVQIFFFKKKDGKNISSSDPGGRNARVWVWNQVPESRPLIDPTYNLFYILYLFLGL